jgi:phage baseplate assembly protein W
MPQTLTFPLTLTPTGHLLAVEQDSPLDIGSCVTSILSTPPGWRIDDPDFGRPPLLAFRQGGVDVQQIADSVHTYEPRATGDIVASTIDDQYRQNVRIDSTGRR